MPLKLIAGVSKKLGLPGYSSVGAICHLEMELDSGLIAATPEAFRAQVRAVYAQCAESVDEELARHQAPRSKPGAAAEMPADGVAAANGSGPPLGSAHCNGQANGNGPVATMATDSAARFQPSYDQSYRGCPFNPHQLSTHRHG